MPRPSNTDQRRADIVRGLAAVMAERGYAKATIKEIARAAGLTPGLVHYHFRDKQQILLSLIEGLAALVRGRMERAAPHARDLFAAIDALLGTEEGVEASAVACWVVIGAEAVRQPEVRELYEALMREALEEFTKAFRAAMRGAGRSDATAGTAAMSVLAAIEGFFRLSSGAPSCVRPGSAAGAVRQIAKGFLDSAARAS
jgi:TetR/AcrR family transcriptional repressor of bet genes